MSSYPLQFLQPNPSPLEGLGEGFGKFAGAMSYNEQQKRKKDEATKNLTDFQTGTDQSKFDLERSMNAQGELSLSSKPKKPDDYLQKETRMKTYMDSLDPEKYDITQGYSLNSGPSVSARPKKPEDFSKTLVDSLAFGGDQQLNDIGQRFGVDRNAPTMSMIDGSQGGVQPMSTPEYGTKIREALFPKYSQEDIRAKAAGLPKINSTKEPNFDQYLNGAINKKTTWDDVYQKFPSKFDTINQVKNNEEMRQEEANSMTTTPSGSGDIRSQVIAELTKSGYPVTPRNIDAAMKQMQGQ